jgi:hypothetical protein
VGFKDVQFLGGGPDVVEDCRLREGCQWDLSLGRRVVLRTLSALPVTSRCSVAGLNATARISESWAWTFSLGSVGVLVSHLKNC